MSEANEIIKSSMRMIVNSGRPAHSRPARHISNSKAEVGIGVVGFGQPSAQEFAAHFCHKLGPVAERDNLGGSTGADGSFRKLWQMSEPCVGEFAGSAISSEAGFTLLEMVCVLAILALLAAILLPRSPVATSRPQLEAYAVEVAALLKADRNAALGRGGAVAAVVDAGGRTVRSGSGPRIIRIPDDVVVEALLPQSCNGRPAFSTISFFATGMSCGGAIRLTRLGSRFEVRVNWLTGGVDIVEQDAF